MKDSDNKKIILDFIDSFGVPDKDKNSSNDQVKRNIGRTKSSLKRKLDLHGMTSDEAENLVVNSVMRHRKNGVRQLLIVHGKGKHSDMAEGPVLKTLVAQLLDYKLSSFIRYWKQADPRDGGDGATMVYF